MCLIALSVRTIIDKQRLMWLKLFLRAFPVRRIISVCSRARSGTL